MKPTTTRLRFGSGGVLYLLVSVVILASAIYTQANLLFWGFGLMVGGMVVSLGWAAVTLRGLRLTRLVPSHAAAGETMALRYRLDHRGWVPAFGVVVRENWGPGTRGWMRVGPAAGHHAMLGGPPHAWVLHLGPRRPVQAQAPCTPRRRGRLSFERAEVSTSFPFSLIHKTLVFEQPQEVMVFPRLHRVRRRLLSNLAPIEGDGRRTLERAGGSEEFFGLRDYRPGDSPRMIDWKRTARTGELVAREMTLPSPPKLMILLDLRVVPPTGAGGRRRGESELLAPAAAGDELEERAVSLAASLISEGHLHGYRVGLRVLGPAAPILRPHHSQTHRTKLLEALARLDLRAERSARKAAGGIEPVQIDVAVWAGRGSGVPMRPGSAGGRVPTVLGAADFDRYVTGAASIHELLLPGDRVPVADHLADAGSPAIRQPQPAATGGAR
jgi:uncharacterized protein (DUF58 family)